MKIIGVCGSSGSGKSTVCRCFQNRGVPVLDCDEIYHKLVNAPSPCLQEIGEQFGFDMIQGGSLDRKKLGAIVFADRSKLERLNEISHRHVIFELDKIILSLQASGFTACAIDAPMLFEAGLDERCDFVVAVIADKQVQIDRICRRDGIEKEQAEKRISNQISSEKLKARADFILENNGTKEDLIRVCNELLDTILP